jgi:ribose 5-phosphate isomerase RpiB
MRVAVVNEVSAAQRNADIMAALQGRELELLNVGMTRVGPDQPALTYIHTGFLSALLLNSGRADFIVAGCGTGQGFEISVSQYPGVFCGHIVTPLDAWLFARINGGNCASLPLNQGYGWAAEVNLGIVFDQLFTVERSSGYPESRKASQQQSRDILAAVSAASHRKMAEIVLSLPDDVVRPALAFPGVWDLLDSDTLTDRMLAEAISRRGADLGVRSAPA